jgi:integrase
LNPRTIEVTLLPLRRIYHRAVNRGELAVNPCTGLEMPAGRGRRERFATPVEAEQLLTAIARADRPFWATAFYGGLRRGELIALRSEDVDLATGVINVRRNWDDKEGEIELKSRSGRRKVPIPAVLRGHLLDHFAMADRTGEQLVFGSGDSIPLDPRTMQGRADTAWKKAGLRRITPHECRHTYASLMIAAGVNAKALSTFMGHANIKVTLDTYGHLMPGSEGEAAELLDGYLAAERKRAEAAARSADPVATGAQTGAQGGGEARNPLDQAISTQ